MPVPLIMGIIQNNYPQLNFPYKILQISRFDTEGPNYSGGRSRVGDLIVLIEGSREFMEGLAKFPSKYLFNMSAVWRVTIKGGQRSDQDKSQESAAMAAFTDQFKNSVLVDSAKSTVEEAKRAYNGSPPL